MPIIKLTTEINAPIERCFLLSLSVELHQASVSQTHEKAIAGVTKGLMKLDDTVTWQATHFGSKLKMTSRISSYQNPNYFVDEMTKGPFKKLHHQHSFNEVNGKTTMTDIFEFQAPFGIIGLLIERMFLTQYLKRFLVMRNKYIKEIAESVRGMETVLVTRLCY